MPHLASLITDLALILTVAAFVTVVCKMLRQPVVLGYIVAGVLVAPQFKSLPSVSGLEDLRVWAELGVIFLLFGLGLEFSFRKLLRVGAAAAVTATVEVVVMMGLGFLAGRLLGWTLLESLFLGGVLSISSTTIILRAFEELGLKSRNFTSLVFGVLVVEDLVAILLLVLLSTVAVSQQFQGGDLLWAAGKLGFFLILWFLGGILLIPPLLRRFAQHLNNETLLVVSLALCLGMVWLAHLVGFSPALGAFVMGSILAETRVRERIEHLLAPIRDLFAAVFFVSVGLMVDLSALAEYAGPVAILSVITVVGKVLSTSVGALIAGRPPRTALQSGMSLAQIGEFSFIIAALGLSLKVVGPQLYPIAVSVSVVTTFLTPYLIRAADPLFDFLWKRAPRHLRQNIERYGAATQRLGMAATNAGESGVFRKLKRAIDTFAAIFLKDPAAAPQAKTSAPPLAPWDAHIAEFTVPPAGDSLGRSLRELAIRERFGVNIALIDRGGRRLPAPGRDERIFPHDLLQVIGNDEQLARFEKFLYPSLKAEKDWSEDEYGLEQLALTGAPAAKLIGKTIRHSGLRESTNGLVVGIERRGVRILNPDSDTTFEADDLLWLVGDRALIRALRESSSESRESDTTVHR